LFIKREKLIIIKQASIDLAILLGNVALTVIVYVVNISRYGTNDNVAVRGAGEIETYGLKIGQLLISHILQAVIQFFTQITILMRASYTSFME
jgi:hypothetical protein